MKKKIYFIVSSILVIIFSFISVFTAKSAVNEEIKNIDETYSMYSDEYKETMKDLLEDKGVILYTSLSVIGIVVNVFILVNSVKGNVLRNKGTFIAASAFDLLMVPSSVVMLLSIANIIILVSSPRKVPEDYPEKKPIPVIEHVKATKKEIIIGIILLVLYFSQFGLKYILPDSFKGYMTGIIIYDVLLFIVIVIAFNKELRNGFKLFFSNPRSYMRCILQSYGIGLIIYFSVTSMVSMISGGANSVNQEALEALPLWYVIPSAVIWAPIVEEVIFRGVLRRFINNKTIFVIVSALIFGFLHATHEEGIIDKILWTLPYASLGGILAYVYAKTDNISNNIILHAIHNSIGSLISLM